MSTQAAPVSLRTARNPLVLWIVTVALTLGLMAGVAEALARAAHVPVFRVQQAGYIGWAQRDPVLGWRNNPGVHLAHEGIHEPMTFLADGSRVSGAPAGKETSILIVGSSFSSGYGVRDEETYAALLQRRFPRERVRNFAVSGYGTYQSLLLLRELVEQRGYRPGLVLCEFLGMHPGRNVLTYDNLEAYRAYGGQRFPPPHVEVHGGQLVAYPPYVVPNWPWEQNSALVSLLHSAALKFAVGNREQYEVAATRMLIDQMKEVASKAGARFVVVTLWRDRQPWLQPTQPYRDDMRRDGIEEFDASYQGQETSGENLLVGGNGHPGPLVHAWWADHIGDWLARERAAGR